MPDDPKPPEATPPAAEPPKPDAAKPPDEDIGEFINRHIFEKDSVFFEG